MDISVHQIHYRQDQISLLDPAFLPYDNAANGTSDWCEWRVIREAYHGDLHKRANFVGFVSWKFKKKTGVSGEALLSFIRKHPGFDVYFVNPYHNAIVTWGFRNIWEEAEQWHTGIKPLTEDLFKRLEYRIDLNTFVSRCEETCYCNYWIANRRFWDAFMTFAEPVANCLECGLSGKQREFLETSRRTTKQGVSFRPFIMERLFTTFLALSRGHFAHIRLPLHDQHDPAYLDCACHVNLANIWKENLSELPNAHIAQIIDQYLLTLRTDYLQRKARLQTTPAWRTLATRILQGRT
jgi:hypothetical protein